MDNSKDIFVFYEKQSKDLIQIEESKIQGLFNMSSDELREFAGIPKDREIDDFLSIDLIKYKLTATLNSKIAIEEQDLHGAKKISECIFKEHRKMRNKFISEFGITPEDTMPGYDLRKLREEYNKKTEECLKHLESE